jgi:hypothetical protein
VRAYVYSVVLHVEMFVRRGACYVGVFYFLYIINNGNTQLLINVKNQVNYSYICLFYGVRVL